MFRFEGRVAALVVAAIALSASACTGISRVTTTASGGEVVGGGSSPQLSLDGRFVAFLSGATNLVPNDTNNFEDVFVRDTVAKTVERVSVATGGAQANSYSWDPQISNDGRYVVFTTWASNLGSGEESETEPDPDIFVRDRQTNTTRLLSKAPDGSHPASFYVNLLDLSRDGRTALFANYRDPAVLVYRVDVPTGAVSIEVPRSVCGTSLGAGASAALSKDGSKVAYSVVCDNGVDSLQPSSTRVLFKDRALGTTQTLWRYDVRTPPFGLVSVASLSLDDAGNKLAWTLADPIDARGATINTVYFWGGDDPPLPLDISKAGYELGVSPNGRYVAYTSGGALSGPPPFLNVGLLDTGTGQHYWVTVNTRGENNGNDVPNGVSRAPVWSGDGSLIGFSSEASDLVPNDTNHAPDGFVRSLHDVLARTRSQATPVS